MEPSYLQKIIAHAKAYGFIFPSSEIYGQLQAVYDYGPYGVLLKERIKTFWKAAMQLTSFRIVALDTAIFMHKKVWEASGHAEAFEDYFVDNLDSKKRYRVDTLAEAFAKKLECRDQTADAQKFLRQFQQHLLQHHTEAIKELFVEYQVKCTVSGTSNWGPVRRLKLMFETKVGATADRAETLYLRPETAQGIYVNFLNIQKSLRLSLPFGVIQIGKAFRNELIARQFTFRMREFEQMEMQFFTSSAQAHHFFTYWKRLRMLWHTYLLTSPGTAEEHSKKQSLHEHTHTHLAHYAQEAADLEYDFPFGRKEVEGIHNRGNFDLSQHIKVSNKQLKYFDARTNEHYVPHVIETSTGLDRIVLMMLCSAYREERQEDRSRIWLAFSPFFAPIQVAVLPLLRKDGLPEYAQKIYESLRLHFSVLYEDQGSIGKRYTRQDLIGTPFCITIDHQTLTDETLTLRHRDTTQQERLSFEALQQKLRTACQQIVLLEKLKKDMQDHAIVS